MAFVQVEGFKKEILKDNLKSVETHDLFTTKKDFVMKELTKILVERGNIHQDTVNLLLDEIGLNKIKIAFTHSSMLGEENSEFYELLGDITLNKCFVWYFYRRFPELKTNPRSMFILTLLKKKYICKNMFANFARKLNFDKLIRWKELSFLENKNVKKMIIDDKMLEDCFEAFAGCLEDLIDSRILLSTGCGVIYNIVCSLLDDLYITINLENLIDKKTQLKELMDVRRSKHGDKQERYETINLPNKKFKIKVVLEFTKPPCENQKFNIMKVPTKVFKDETKKYFDIVHETWYTIDFTSDEVLRVIDGENNAADMAIKWLKEKCIQTIVSPELTK